jgi:hypothetical protein
VNPDVSLEISSASKGPAAVLMRAQEGLLTGVGVKVTLERAALGEPLPAVHKGALEGLLPRVNPLVSLEVS